MANPETKTYCSECGEPKKPEDSDPCDNCLPACADCGDPAQGLEEKYCVDCWRDVQAREDDFSDERR